MEISLVLVVKVEQLDHIPVLPVGAQKPQAKEAAYHLKADTLLVQLQLHQFRDAQVK
jgi:hypothetical protein